ncbi:MAG: integration host factor subunit beta [Alphaproteobacteria bacterium]|nr:integration host factor subunit beta [Alphaproteobacteria bacterium]
MTRSELVKKVYEGGNPFQEDEVSRALDVIFEAFQESLCKGLRIELRDFGVMSLRQRSARQARNPRNGQSVSLPAKKYLHFKMGKYLRQVMNQQSR